MRKIHFILTLLLYGFFSLTHTFAYAQSETDEARAHLQAFLDSADRYSARFVQQLVDDEGDVLEEGEGKFWLQRPGQFRWHYEPPMERLLVSDGEQIWLYDVELEQVTVRSADGALEQTPAGLLVASSMALENYQLSIRERSGDFIAVGMIPTQAQSDFEDIVLGLEGNRLVSLTLADHFGQKTIITFQAIDLNPPIDLTIFSLDIPPGTDVIDQTVQ